MKNKKLIALSVVLMLGFFNHVNAETVKRESTVKTGYVELNGVRYFNNFFAQVEIEYVESELVWGIMSKIIRNVYITGYKFCPPNVESRVAWTSTGGKLKLRKVDSSYRFNAKTPLFTGSIIGQQIWIEFPGFLD